MEGDIYRWHYDYSRLAWESGFSFDNNKTRKTFDRNKIALLDIERIVRDRDIAVVESHLENVLDYKLDTNELKILDPSFVKIIQLCQLSVEYLIYCKKYLDKTVVILKSDLEKKTEENELSQKELVRVITENNKYKRKIKDLTLSLYYQHQLKQNLNTQMTIYQCNECGKTFVNSEYLNAHLKRRHNMTDEILVVNENETIPQNTSETTLHITPEHEIYKTETARLQSEIKVLKEKLNSAERYFSPEIRNNGNISPEHGKVKIKTSPMYIECFNDIKGLKQQFDMLKNSVQSELEQLKSQKLDQDKYAGWIQEVFEKIENKKTTDQSKREINAVSNNRRTSYVQTEETVDNPNENIRSQEQNKLKNTLVIDNFPITNISSSQVYEVKTKVPSDDKSSSFVKVGDEANNQIQDVNITQEIEKKLEEKTKKEVEKLGELLNEKMSTSFNMLQNRMEIFWNKFNEKASLISDTPSPIPIPAKIEDKISTAKVKTVSKTLEMINNESHTINNEMISFKSTFSESDSLSETESNRHILSDNEIPEPKQTPTPKSRNHNAQKFIDELKSKVEEQKLNVDKKSDTTDYLQKKYPTKIIIGGNQNIKQIIQRDSKLNNETKYHKPVSNRILSKPKIKSTTESETESSTESDSEISSSEESVEIKAKPKIVKDIIKSNKAMPQKGTVKRTVPTKSNVSISREEIIEDVNNRLLELGIQLERNSLATKIYKQKNEIVLQERNTIMKKNSLYPEVRERILQEIEKKMKSLRHSHLPESPRKAQQKTSKFKSIVSSMKTKAKLLMKPEKSPTRPTPLYKLHIHYDSPYQQIEKIITPRKENKQVKEKAPLRREKIIIKSKSMYKNSDSDSVKSDDEYINTKRNKNIQGEEISPRKSISVSSLLSEHTDKKSKSLTMPRSISNLDSILELKKELKEEIKIENLTKQEQILSNFSSDESISEELLKSKDTVEQKYSDQEAAKHKEIVQKSVLKNYPSASSLVKKKVLFDLDSDALKSEEFQKNLEEKKSTIKTNTFFDFDKEEDSTSVTSSVFDGSKTNLNQLPKDKISTKAQINIPAKPVEKHDSESDFDISDLL